jgi:hypothetical protein
VHVGVVVSLNEVLFLAVAPSEEALRDQVATHVAENADVALRPEDECRVRSSLSREDLEGAIHHYFAHVGKRWDPQRLHTQELDLG